ncbi:hypothetical protein H072_3205 [Dactylellina haptotyla CBS 200.50]|uniref:Zinc finger PHD-type domain-containing protein n=1 Tax=Dactylellina haptotyla (strain CBS 200.50) TaxID=1284197 RepID=S8AIH4_DACHA|nr:hypothetical protein H072_3205 [Dactylellina haptotyla CBS 200.50]
MDEDEDDEEEEETRLGFRQPNQPTSNRPPAVCPSRNLCNHRNETCLRHASDISTCSTVHPPPTLPPSIPRLPLPSPPLPRLSANQQQQQQQPLNLPQPSNPLHQQWQFAAVWEFLFQFHQGLKSPFYDDIEEFARDISSAAGTTHLHDVQIGLLKNVSSQRGLTIEMFEDYTRRQYMSKNPTANPFGSDPDPISFYKLEPETRVSHPLAPLAHNSSNLAPQIRVLHQLCMWILAKPEAFREKVDPHKLVDNTDWRIDPIGWDSKGTAYYQFDNSYLYCRTEPALPVYQKWKSRKSIGSRSTKRRKVFEPDEEPDSEEYPALIDENDIFVSQIEWKCLCSNLEEYRALVTKFERSKHPDEKELRKVIIEDILPIFEKDELKRKRKLVEEEKERLRLELLSGRKRSARVDERIARQREAEERDQVLRIEREERQRHEKEELQKQREEEVTYPTSSVSTRTSVAKYFKARLAKLEEREKRLQERELRARQREEERVRLLDPDATESEDNQNAKRKSSRQREKLKTELETEDNNWVFDCICGIHGLNYDDGTYSIACDKCGVWQHTKCLGLPQSAAEEEEFICDRCHDKEKAATSPPIKIKLRLTRPASSDGESGNNHTWPDSSLKRQHTIGTGESALQNISIDGNINTQATATQTPMVTQHPLSDVLQETAVSDYSAAPVANGHQCDVIPPVVIPFSDSYISSKNTSQVEAMSPTSNILPLTPHEIVPTAHSLPPPPTFSNEPPSVCPDPMTNNSSPP